MYNQTQFGNFSGQTERAGNGRKIEHGNEIEMNSSNHINNYFKNKKSGLQPVTKKQKTDQEHGSGPEPKVPSCSTALALPCHLEGTALEYVKMELEMSKELQSLRFSDPVCYIYNPLEYALASHCDFARRYCGGSKKFLFVGMNPGPFGMVQTGVPFGDVAMARDWLRVTGDVGKPAIEHPKRPILGFDCHRSEVSGSRFWGYFRKRCGSPERFFSHCFVYNMCPLSFMQATGKNITPPQIKANQRKLLNDICTKYFCRVVTLLQAEVIIGVGNFARDRAKEALRKGGLSGVRVEVILHPSPASPAANKGWEGTVQRQLTDIGMDQYL